ncbi:uncharacterized protein B0H18DRAFT_1001807 [Fomitopsis serialis]|uniref:uncharacterized protein n=1 Tax=Fomitopsis serialis TaxID=139415 RepID=UPI002008BCE6|nr:uncharacterized protein B0H18DRAFT_1001807 [Neoantrodia serialis]KAH9928200.1 hypothetical protein B0H18DRAFT_1001807 [Neoantrodia serialis]
MAASVSAFFDELASSDSSVLPSSVSAPPASETICPSLLQIVAPQPTRPVNFVVIDHTDSALREADVDMDAVLQEFMLPLDSEAQGVVNRIAGLPPLPLPSRSCDTSPARRRIEKGKRTPQACERCRIRKTKCNGGRPSCERCIRLGATCGYVLDHKAVRTQLRKLQKEGLLSDTIDLSPRRTRSHGEQEPAAMSRPARMTRSRSRLALNSDLASGVGASGAWSAPGAMVGQDMIVDTAVGTEPSGYHYPQPAAGPQWTRSYNNISLPRLTVPSLSNGSSSSSSSRYTPLVTPTDEGYFQLGETVNDRAKVFATSGAMFEQAMFQRCPSYPPPITPYPGRSFPPMTTSGKYYDERTLLPGLCGDMSNLGPGHANGRLASHGFIARQQSSVDPTISAGAVWKDASLPEFGSAPGPALWNELFGGE